MSPTSYRRLEPWLVILIAVHSAAVGALLVFLPGPVLELTGWLSIPPLFFVRQGGVFHFVVAFGYLLEYRRRKSVTLLVFTKALAMVFLILVPTVDAVPMLVPVFGVLDGIMGAVVWWVHRQARRAAGAAGENGG